MSDINAEGHKIANGSAGTVASDFVIKSQLDALAADAVEIDGITTGTVQLTTYAFPATGNVIAYVKTVKDFYHLDRTSTLTADGFSIITALGGVGRWIRMRIAHPFWVTQTTWQIDPVAGNDDNLGDTSHPLKTLSEYHLRLWGAQLLAGVDHNVTITSDLNAGDIVQAFFLTAEDGVAFTGYVHYFGTQSVKFSGSLDNPSGIIVRNGATSQPTLITCSGLSGTWSNSGTGGTSLVGLIIKRTSDSSTACVVQDMGGKQAWISQPISSVALPVTWANGDAFTVYNVPSLGQQITTHAGLTEFHDLKVSGRFLTQYGQVNMYNCTGDVVCLGGSFVYSQNGLTGLISGGSFLASGSYASVSGGYHRLICTTGTLRLNVTPTIKALQIEGNAVVTALSGGSQGTCDLEFNQTGTLANLNPAVNFTGISGGRVINQGYTYGTLGSSNTLVNFDGHGQRLDVAQVPTVTGGAGASLITSTHGLPASTNVSVLATRMWDDTAGNVVVGPAGTTVNDNRSQPIAHLGSGGTTPTNAANIGDVQALALAAVAGSVVTGAPSGSTNLGSFTAGVLQQTISGGVATITPLQMVTGQIPFGLSSGLLGQDVNIFWDNTNKRLGIGTIVPSAALTIDHSTFNDANTFVVLNSNAGTLTNASVAVSNGTAAAAFGMNGTGHTGGGNAPNLTPNMAFVSTTILGPNPTLYLGSHGIITLQTGATQAERLKIDAAGNISLSTLNVGGVVHAAPASGQLSVGTINTADITAAAVDNTKLATMATARFKARITAGTGAPEDITGTQATTLLDVFTSSLKGLTPASGGGALNFLRADGTWATPAGAGSPLTDGDKGDVVVSGGGTVWTIDVGVVTNTQLATMATARFKGRVTAGTGAPEDLTGTQATTMLDVFSAALKGLTPASGGGTTNFLRADGTWTLPPGFALTDGDKGDIVVSGSGTVWTIDTAVVTTTKIADQNVTLGKLEPIGPSKILGNDGPATQSPFDISVVAPLTMVPGNGQLTFATGFTPGSVVFQGASQIAQNNANFFWNDTNHRLGIGTNVPIQDLDVRDDVNGSTMVMVRNQGTGVTALAQFVATTNSGGGIGVAVGVAGTNFTATSNRPLVGAGVPYIVPYFGSSNLYIGAPGTLIFATGATETNRLQILNGGQINIASLSAGGVVQAASSTGQLSSLTMVAGQIPFGAVAGGGLAQDSTLVWDNTNKRLGVGTNTPGFDIDVTRSSTSFLAMQVLNTNAGINAGAIFSAQNGSAGVNFGMSGSGFGGSLSSPNLGASTGFMNSGTAVYIGAKSFITLQTGNTNAERMRLLSTGETVVFGKLSGGTAPATELVLQGTTDPTLRGHVTSLDPFGVGRSAGVLGGAPMFAVAGGVSVNSSAGASLNYVVVNSSTVTITGSTAITNSAGFNFVTIEAPVYSGTVAIGAGGFSPPAATLVVSGAPSVTGGASFNNGASLGPLGLWVKASSQIDGSLNLSNDLNMNGTLRGNLATFLGAVTLSSGNLSINSGTLIVGGNTTLAGANSVVFGAFQVQGDLGFFNQTPTTKQTITGSRAAMGAAGFSMLQAGVAYGLWIDGTSP